VPQEVFLVILGIVAIIALIGGLILFGRHMAKKRAMAMKAVALDLGLEFSPTRDDALLDGLQRFSLFSRGRNHQMKNAMKSRKDSANLTIFDYTYVVGGGKSTQYHFHTVLVMESDSLRLPVFTLRPEGLLDRIGGALGSQDIDFDDHPEFSKLFVLKGNDKGSNEEAIRSVFDRKVIEAFAGRKGVTVAGIPGMMVYMKGGRQKPKEIGEFMNDGCAVFSAFAERLSR
jgi:hypothetical protein